MNDKHLKGGFNDVKGKVKEDFGHATGNSEMAGDGVLDQVKGKAQKIGGDLKDAVKRGVDTVLGRKDIA